MTTWDGSPRLAVFVVYVSAVFTGVLLLFPPFTGINGIEHAFFLTGPQWAVAAGSFAADLGLTASVHWIALIVQIAAIWAIALGAIWFFGSTERPGRLSLVPAMMLAIVSFLLVPPGYGQTPTQETDTDDLMQTDLTVGLQGGKYGVGFASSWPSYGLSGTLQISETLTAGAVAGLFGTISNIGGRVWYRFNRNATYDIYGYAGASLLRYGYSTFTSTSGVVKDTESVLGLGAGAGLDVGLQTLLNNADLPPIFFNWEVGIAHADFDFYQFSSFTFGGGIHYRFGNH